MSFPQGNLFAQSSPAPVHRLFFALLPSGQERERLADLADLLHPAFLGARWIRPQRYHLTLHYLGESEGRREAHVQAAQAAACGLEAEAFAVTLDHLRALGNPASPALTLAAREVSAPLEAFWRKLQAALIRAGFKQHIGHGFVPHLTLGYVQPGPATGAVVPVTLRPQAFHLVHSVQGQADYEILGTWPIAA
ncbi:RNA 2',3'-cyclic phosphodiesterase [Pseudoxanthomonas wuyuanensis]